MAALARPARCVSRWTASQLGPFVALPAGGTPHPALAPVVADLRARAAREPGVEQ